MMRGLESQRGQATVELVALLPMLAVVALALFTALAAGRAAEQAGAAAEAGAVALLQDADPVDAARAAAPGVSRRAIRVSVRGRRVTVRVRPRVPLLASALVADATADAGPGARP